MCIVEHKWLILDFNIINILTSVYSMFEIDNHITQFLEDFKVTLDNMTQTEFETLVSIFFNFFYFPVLQNCLTFYINLTILSLNIYISADAL